MKGSMRPYPLALSILGVVVLGWSIGLLATTKVDFFGLLLITLTILARWIRIELDPPSYIDLTPFTILAALLLAGPSIALFAAIGSVLVSSRFFVRSPWWIVAADIGEEGVATLAVVIIATLAQLTATSLPSAGGLLAFSLTVVIYIVLRLVLAGLRSRATEGIKARAFIRNAGKYMAGHLILLSLLALGMILLYAKVGYLVLLLATVALIEFYIPGKLIGDQRNALFANLAVMAQVVDLKDEYTATHLHNVETIAIRTARAIGLPESEVRRIRIGALLHDIGKVGVSGKIIRKPAKLDADETAIMRRHPVIGAEIMKPVEILSEAAEIVRHAHEHYDGMGYPDGLKGESIPIGSRVILVADAYDAITSDRPYRKRRSKEEALAELRRGAGTQFDPKVVKGFESVIDHID